MKAKGERNRRSSRQAAFMLGCICPKQERHTFVLLASSNVLQSVSTLLERIRDHLHASNAKMDATLRYLAGGLYSDICFFCGISVPAFYCIVWRTIHAINKAITINFPTSAKDCAIHGASFENISHRGIIMNCVVVLDGFLLEIIAPSKLHAKNVGLVNWNHHGCWYVASPQYVWPRVEWRTCCAKFRARKCATIRRNCGAQNCCKKTVVHHLRLAQSMKKALYPGFPHLPDFTPAKVV